VADSFNIELFSFAKRENSTLRPSTTGTVFSGTLKSATSVQNPVIGLEFGKDYSPAHANFAYIPEFGNRYYWITDWEYNSGLWYAQMSVDPLATLRDVIGESRQYVVRSSDEYNGDIMDTTYTTRGNSVYNGWNLNPEDIGWNPNFTDGGSYVIGIVNNDDVSAAHRTGIAYYVVPEFTGLATLSALRNYLMTQPNYLMAGIDEIGAGLTKALVNPFQYISSCKWFPFQVPMIRSGSNYLVAQNVRFGWWDTPLNFARLHDDPIHDINFTMPLPKHPQAEARGAYLNLEPYSRYFLYAQPWGMIPIDSTHIMHDDFLTIRIRTDCITGLSVLTLSNSFTVFFTASANLALNINFAQVTRDDLGLVQTVGNAIGNTAQNIATANVGGAISSVFNGIIDGVRAAIPQMRTTGASDSVLAINQNWQFRGQFFQIVDEAREKLGRPLCQFRIVRDLPGFLQIHNPDISGYYSEAEISAAKNFMSGGFFYE